MSRKSNSLRPEDAHVGRRVKMRRMELGISQTKLGDAIGVTFQQVQKYERGTNRIGSSRLQMIAGVLGVTAAHFFDGLPKFKTDNSNAHSPAYIKKFLASADGIALIEAFQKISRGEVRRRIVDLVESLAGPENSR